MIAETFRSPNAGGQLTRLCDRWIYSSCLFFALPPEERKKSGFHYEYSVYQLEYSRNLLFHRGAELDRVAQAVIDRTRSSLDITTVTTLLGYKRRPKYRRNGTRGNRFEAKLERPEYDLTVFKLHFGKLTLKVYTKGERVLRIEAIVHNVEVLRCPRSLSNFPDIAALLAQILERFLESLACVEVCSVRGDTWEHLRQLSCVGTTRVPGVDISKPRMHLFIEAVIALAAKPKGFSIKELAAKVREIGGSTHPAYSTSQAAFDLRKLRGKSFLLKVPKSHRYICSPSGLQAMAAILIINDKVIRPLLAGAGNLQQGRPCTACSPVELHYCRLQQEMRSLFNTLGIAA